MSAPSTTPDSVDSEPDTEDVYECPQCEGPRPGGRSFCSASCRRQHERETVARDILHHIEHDHRFCATCFRQVKEIEEPTNASLLGVEGIHSTESVIGYEHPTEHADRGELTDQRCVDEDDPRVVERDLVRRGVICECGATDLSAASAGIRDGLDADALAERFFELLETHHVEEIHGHLVYWSEMLAALEASADVREAIAAGLVLDE